MKINPSIFKAYDIRGIYPSELNEEVIYKIGRAYAVLIQKENEGKITIAVAKAKFGKAFNFKQFLFVACVVKTPAGDFALYVDCVDA
ncbi:MAG: hypothetical protein COX43_00050 [Parcubacteria group bacterium CG23_combo_of_CG06-09_8_20_14_all_35_9]|nr:MAG: hypothetical protein COX43_00050 [Parcubacteria group bacterium CG23_combo_of_CG06-09_8_20_14_all_35_9]